MLVDTNLKKVFAANVGDSQFALLSGTRMHFVSPPHDLKGKELARIKTRGGHVEDGYVCVGPDQLNMSRSMGDTKFAPFVIAEADVFDLKLDQVDAIVVGCDGVWGVMKDKDVCHFVGSRLAQNHVATAEDLGKHIVETLQGDDNVTFILAVLS